ncbi:MAG: hypothetical protein MUC53_00160 [Candidatus Contendobacter sp.]|jgi:hypothetical protein|nr:hypothetical protein [Candidatus Contendobacter sp.]
MNRTLLSLALILAAPAFGQTMYKCPNAAGVVAYQQMPCTPTGGGESIAVKSIPMGAGSGISDNARAYLAERDRYRAEQAQAQAEADKEERRMTAEHHKARATEEQAAAQRATARAIWATGWRR